MTLFPAFVQLIAHRVVSKIIVKQEQTYLSVKRFVFYQSKRKSILDCRTRRREYRLQDFINCYKKVNKRVLYLLDLYTCPERNVNITLLNFYIICFEKRVLSK